MKTENANSFSWKTYEKKNDCNNTLFESRAVRDDNARDSVLSSGRKSLPIITVNNITCVFFIL